MNFGLVKPLQANLFRSSFIPLWVPLFERGLSVRIYQDSTLSTGGRLGRKLYGLLVVPVLRLRVDGGGGILTVHASLYFAHCRGSWIFKALPFPAYAFCSSAADGLSKDSGRRSLSGDQSSGELEALGADECPSVLSMAHLSDDHGGFRDDLSLLLSLP